MAVWPVVFALAGGPARPSATFAELRQALTHCFAAPPRAAGSLVTVRFSLKRDGTVFGRPRVTFLKLMGRPEDRAAFEKAVAESLNACTPVSLAPGLGAVIAGQPLTVLFPGDGRAPVLRGF